MYETLFLFGSIFIINFVIIFNFMLKIPVYQIPKEMFSLWDNMNQ